MAFAHAYVDDSATDRLDKRLFFAGYLMPAEQSAAFSNLWDSVRVSGRPIEYLKMREANRLEGQFWGWSGAERNAKLKSFANIISVFNPVSFELSVSRVAYDNTVTPASPRGFGRPHFSCAFMTIAIIARYASTLFPPLTVDFIFDEQEGVDDDVNMFFSVLWGQLPAQVRKCINGKPIFRNDMSVKPLQAADMLAWHIRRDYEDNTERWSHPMLERLINHDIHIANSLDEEMMERWAKDSLSLPMIKLQSKGEWARAKASIRSLRDDNGKIPIDIRVRTRFLVWKIKLRRLFGL